jgi:uncharacterized membrane protein
MSQFSEGPQRTPFDTRPMSDEIPYTPTHIVVVAFPDAEQARSALADVQKLVSENKLRLADASVVELGEDGTLHVTETADMGAGGGAARGGLAGLVVGSLALVPVAGIAIGAAAGAWLAKRRDAGFSRGFQEKIGEVLRPGAAALALLTEGGDAEAALEMVSHWNAQVVSTDLDEDAERELREALGRDAE